MVRPYWPPCSSRKTCRESGTASSGARHTQPSHRQLSSLPLPIPYHHSCCATVPHQPHCTWRFWIVQCCDHIGSRPSEDWVLLLCERVSFGRARLAVLVENHPVFIIDITLLPLAREYLSPGHIWESAVHNNQHLKFPMAFSFDLNLHTSGTNQIQDHKFSLHKRRPLLRSTIPTLCPHLQSAGRCELLLELLNPLLEHRLFAGIRLLAPLGWHKLALCRLGPCVLFRNLLVTSCHFMTCLEVAHQNPAFWQCFLSTMHRTALGSRSPTVDSCAGWEDNPGWEAPISQKKVIKMVDFPARYGCFLKWWVFPPNHPF